MPHAATSLLALAAMLPLSLAACASNASGGDGDAGPAVADGAAFTLEMGGSVTLADRSRLRYLRLINDSRCPPQHQCVWAGDAVLAFEWQPADGAAQPFELHTGLAPRSHAVGERKVTLKSLARGTSPAADLLVEAGP